MRMAVSTASEPEPANITRLMPAGATEATVAASSVAGGVVVWKKQL